MAYVESGAGQVDANGNPINPNQPGAGAPPAAQGAALNQPATSTGAGPVTATGAANISGQVTGANAPTQPFQNISQYLAANAPQSQQLAGQVANTVSTPINQAGTDITNAANTFTSGVNAGFTPSNTALTNAVAANPASVVAENPQNVLNFASQLNNPYTGPTDFTQAPGYSNLETEIANAQALAGNVQNTAGIQSLLGGIEGPTTAGINTLDTALLNTPGNLATIQNAGAGATALPGTLSGTTTAENTLAGQGATTAAGTQTAAQNALATALANESGNLGNEQNTIQGIVNQYNKSAGIMNPVTSTIASDIQNFLAANPNITLNNATAPLTPLENIANVQMPNEATYASPQDYAQIAALAQLGLTPAQLSTFPIGAGTSNEAQTFNVPTALQNAIGQIPGLETALTNELNQVGGQINTAVQPYENAQAQVDKYNALQAQLTTLNQQVAPLKQLLAEAVDDPAQQATIQAQLAPLQAQLDAVNQQIAPIQAQGAPSQQDANVWTQSLGWVNPAISNYQTLVNQINSELGNLGNVSSPTLNYAPTSAPTAGGGTPLGQELLKGANIGVAALNPASAAQIAIEPAIQPAITNITQNPILAGAEALGNTTLSLATLDLPPSIFNSIGAEIGSVMDDIGSFFGGLF